MNKNTFKVGDRVGLALTYKEARRYDDESKWVPLRYDEYSTNMVGTVESIDNGDISVKWDEAYEDELECLDQSEINEHLIPEQEYLDKLSTIEKEFKALSEKCKIEMNDIVKDFRALSDRAHNQGYALDDLVNLGLISSIMRDSGWLSSSEQC